jgi:hypothetical protein
MRPRQRLSLWRWLRWKLTGRCDVRLGDEFVDDLGHVHRLVWLRGDRALTDRGLRVTVHRRTA